jgi:hypothetical protein
VENHSRLGWQDASGTAGGMNHFTDAVKMVDQWRKATPQESVNGFVAVCMVMEQIRTEKGGRVDYMRSYYYKPEMLERRAKRGDDVPTWFTAPKQESDWSAEFLDYVTGAEPSEGVRRKLEEMRAA